MPLMMKLGQQLQTALALGLAADLVAIVATTTHPKRLQELFRQASARLLKSHQQAQQRPASAALAHERLRCKALLDLIRARSAAIGSRKPSVDKILTLMDVAPPKNVIEIRKAA